MGVHTDTLRGIIAGRLNPSDAQATRIAEVLAADPADLFGEKS
jgi:hypothetical protein